MSEQLTPEQELLALGIRYNLRQLHSAERVISDLQAVMAGETSVKDLLEEWRYLLAISKVAESKAISKHKRDHTLPDAVCDDMLAELEEIDNDETK